MTKQITFKAYIPPIQSALKFGGNIARITLEVPETELQNALPLVALQNCSLQITVEMDEGVQTIKSVKATKEKGEWGRYWQAMFATGFEHNFDIQEVLEVMDGSEVKQALYGVFEVDSLSFVAPAAFEAWADKNHLQPLITLSRQAVMKTAA